MPTNYVLNNCNKYSQFVGAISAGFFSGTVQIGRHHFLFICAKLVIKIKKPRSNIKIRGVKGVLL